MTILPSELEIKREAANLLDAILAVSQTYLTGPQLARALSEIEIRLIELRQRWAQPVLGGGR
jgi:hypothetical protein